MSNFKNKKIVVILTGSIACYKAASLISTLVQQGANVQTVCTSAALNFLGKATLEGLTGNKVLSDTFEEGFMMEHIHRARWADLIVVYPCSANFLARWAGGFASDLASTLLLAREPEVPLYFAPAMNSVMWSNPITKKNVNLVIQSGAQLISPESGVLACGETGEGRLAEPEVALKILESCFNDIGKVLITYGGTSEPIDSVRSITNFSTGSTGRVLAESLAQKGWGVTALHGASAPKAFGVRQSFQFSDFSSLNELIKWHLEDDKYDFIIHLAAVSDFSVDKVVDGSGNDQSEASKISSQHDLTIQLKRNFKILQRLKEYSSNPNIKVCGFKLTVNASGEEIQKEIKGVLESGFVDYVVHNDLQEAKADHSFRVFDSNQNEISRGVGKQTLADHLDVLMQMKVSPEKGKEVQV